MVTMLIEKELRARFGSTYTKMALRARPRLWKSGKRKDTIRTPGIDKLPFSRDQFWAHGMKLVGPNVIQCPYCVEIGRPANLITLANCVFDHKLPVIYGGTWELSNLVAVCADCNNCKGKLSYEFFIGIMAAIEKWPSQQDRTNIHMCLRTHGVTQRLRGFVGKKPEKDTAPDDAPTTPTLPLRDDDW